MYQLTAQFSDMPPALLSTITESRMLASDGKFNPNFASEGSNILFLLSLHRPCSTMSQYILR